ncbi:MAG: penicillin-binding protein 1C [Alphaproteobacteria bacterium]|nr:penicillin-binding protein 1C [Alphaproteobacteria bacterium]
MIRLLLSSRRFHLAGGGAVLLAAVAVLADLLFPPDLSRLEDSSQLVLASDGSVLRGFTTESGFWRLPADPDAVAPVYLEMLLAWEDQRFRGHPGVDPLAAGRAFGQLIRHGRIVSGASTITMQTARLLEPKERTLGAKLHQMWRAVQLERRFDKDEILTQYLTLAPYGGNLEGIRAASLAWFGKEPRHLAPSEAALLVALPQSPESLRPDRYPDRARAARDKVLSVMEERGVLSADTVAEARQDPIPSLRRPMPFDAPHFAWRMTASHPGARVIRSTIDGELQRALEHLVLAEQDMLDDGASLAIMVVENETRRVLAYLGSSDFFDDSRHGQIDMIQAVRSPGSTLKPFIYGMAFDDLMIHPETVVADMPTRYGNYTPENFLKVYRGEVTIREALQHSLNIPAVTVLQRVGPRRVDARLRGVGTRLEYGGEGEPGLPLALGGLGTTLQDLVALYTGLANGGVVVPLAFTPDETDRPGPVALMGEAAAWYVTRILEDAPPPGDYVDSRATRERRRIAFKTGTSYGYRDAWAIGYDARYTVGVWIGRPDGTPSPDRFGRATAAPVLFKVFLQLPRSGSPANPRRPEDVLDVAARDLPPGLRRISAGEAAPDTISRSLTQPLLVSFPPDGAVVELREGEGGYAPLPLIADGGRKPLRWLVNGEPVEALPHRRRADWRPDGEGFVQITVIDAEGTAARAQVLLK